MPDGAHQRVSLSTKTSLAQRGQGETVLIVEDEPRLRRVTAASLADLGYRVLEADNGMVATEILAQHPEIEILFSDLLMPGELSGLDLAKRVGELYPKVHIVLTSAYCAELLDASQDHLGLQVLRKPYRPAELAQAFRRALQSS